MKVSVLMFALVMVVSVKAQSFNNIIGAVQSGNAGALAATFQGNVEITIKDAQQSYSKSQAEMVLRNFFASHPVKSFAVNHQGTSPEGAQFIIGTLQTGAGTFRTYILAKPTGGALAIQVIRFED
jgi:hypothetical protein